MIILDTSVLVSALVSRNPGRAPQILLLAALRQQIALLLSPSLAEEYERVLTRAHHQRRHGLHDGAVARLVGGLVSRARYLTPAPASMPCPDPDDAHLWALLEAEPGAILVTSERALIEADHFPGRVVSPRAMVDQLGLVG